MNIPLINSNSKQDINTSLIAIRNAINELSRMKESASVEDLQRQINIINQQIVNFNSEFSAINTHLNTIDTNILNLQPVDTVASGNLHSVTSNAVALFANPLIKWESTTTIKARIKVGDVAGNWTNSASMLKLNNDYAIVVFNVVRGTVPTTTIINTVYELTGATQLWTISHEWAQEGNIFTQQMYKNQFGCWLNNLNTNADIVAFITVLVRLS